MLALSQSDHPAVKPFFTGHRARSVQEQHINPHHT
jgi:ABC-type transporter Mla maintaining outer membrane lipid asymmetry ATPase subunit MlaF